MINLPIFLKSLTFSWIKRLTNGIEAMWKNIALSEFQKVSIGMNIFKCNCNYESLNYICKQQVNSMVLFYHKLVELWFQIMVIKFQNSDICMNILCNFRPIVCLRQPRGQLNILNSKSFCFSKFSKFNKFINRYQACFYLLFECISHGDFTFITVAKFQNVDIFETFVTFLTCRLLYLVCSTLCGSYLGPWYRML